MTAAEESVRAGRLDEALADLQGQVRKQSADPRLRIFLFQLLSVMGQWERALTQLNVAADLDPSAVAMLKTYQEALRCEILRTDVFAGRRTPLLFGQPAEWLALLGQALKLTAEEKFADAAALRAARLRRRARHGRRIDHDRRSPVWPTADFASWADLEAISQWTLLLDPLFAGCARYDREPTPLGRAPGCLLPDPRQRRVMRALIPHRASMAPTCVVFAASLVMARGTELTE